MNPRPELVHPLCWEDMSAEQRLEYDPRSRRQRRLDDLHGEYDPFAALDRETETSE